MTNDNGPVDEQVGWALHPSRSGKVRKTRLHTEGQPNALEWWASSGPAAVVEPQQADLSVPSPCPPTGRERGGLPGESGGAQLPPTMLVFLSLESCRHSGPWDLTWKQSSFLGEDIAGKATQSTVTAFGISRLQPES